MDEELLQRIRSARYGSKELLDAVCEVDRFDFDVLDPILDEKERQYWENRVGSPDPKRADFPMSHEGRLYKGTRFMGHHVFRYTESQRMRMENECSAVYNGWDG